MRTQRGFRCLASILAAAIFFGAVQYPKPASAQIELLAGAATLGGALDVLQGQVDAMVNHAKSAADDATLVAAGQVATLLSDARAQFQSTLDHTVAELTGVETNTLTSVEGAIGDINQKLYAEAEQLVASAQLVVNTIPLADKTPQLAHVAPSYLFPGTADATISMTGNFFWAAQPGYSASLDLLGKTLAPQSNTTTALTFTVPRAAIATNATFQDVHAVLHVPYHQCYFLIANCDHVEDFGIEVGILPSSPGSVSVHVDQPYAGTATKYASHEFHATSTDGDHISECYSWAADAGTEVVPSSAYVMGGTAKGDYTFNNTADNCSQPTAVGWRATVRQHHWPNCCDGDIDWKVGYWESYPVNGTSHFDLPMPSVWNTIAPPVQLANGATWTVHYVRFDGAVLDISSSFNDGFLNVKPYPDRVEISTFPFGAFSVGGQP